MTTSAPETIRQLGEASQWLARLREEPNSEETVNGWLRWCELNPANADAFERVQRLWRQLDQVPPPPIVPTVRSARWSVCAVLLCAVVVGALWYPHPHPGPEQSLSVAAPANRLASLPDGSSIHLAAKTSVAVDFTGSERRLRMSSGEAFFKVRPDKTRPFIVRAGPLSVTAVGTAFDVKADQGRFSVTVQQGVVTVAPDKVPGRWVSDMAWRVGPGYQFQYSEREGTAGLLSVDTSAVLAWREGRLEYVNAPLAQVVADVNRYAREPIEITDAPIGRLTFTGTVFTDSIDGWLRGLPGALPVQVEHGTMGRIQIQGRVTPPRQ